MSIVEIDVVFFSVEGFLLKNLMKKFSDRNRIIPEKNNVRI
jgi:hypothetical protein